MMTIDPSTPLRALDGSPIRRIALDWRDTLRTVGTLAAKAPGAPVSKVLEAAAQVIGEAEGTGMTLKDAVVDALLSGKASEDGTAEDKLKRWELALRFFPGNTVSLLPAEVVYLDQCLAQVFKAAVYGPARDALNGVSR